MNKDFMSEAIRLSREGMRANAGGPFGAVVVKDGKMIGRGCNQVTSSKDPTAARPATVRATAGISTAPRAFSARSRNKRPRDVSWSGGSTNPMSQRV